MKVTTCDSYYELQAEYNNRLWKDFSSLAL